MGGVVWKTVSGKLLFYAVLLGVLLTSGLRIAFWSAGYTGVGTSSLTFVILDKLAALFFALTILVFVFMWARAVAILADSSNMLIFIMGAAAGAVAIAVTAVTIVYAVSIRRTYECLLWAVRGRLCGNYFGCFYLRAHCHSLCAHHCGGCTAGRASDSGRLGVKEQCRDAGQGGGEAAQPQGDLRGRRRHGALSGHATGAGGTAQLSAELFAGLRHLLRRRDPRSRVLLPGAGALAGAVDLCADAPSPDDVGSRQACYQLDLPVGLDGCLIHRDVALRSVSQYKQPFFAK